MTGKIHEFVASGYCNTFSGAHAPVLSIHPGDTVRTKTVDAWGFDGEGNRVAGEPNPQTGPFFVEGAHPGDTLVVRLRKIEPNRSTAWSGSLLAPYVVDPAFLRFEGERVPERQIWNLDSEARVARLVSERIRPPRLEIPIRPMLGCIATAPSQGEAISTTTPGPFGGNMDYNGMVAGAQVLLPVFVAGALLFIGDGHAAQGDGEVLGNALEVSMDVEFSVELIRGKTIQWPRLETETDIVVLGSARPLLQALQHATTELQRWLIADWGFDERGSSLLLGHALRYDIANVVDPNFTVGARLAKSFLDFRND